VAGRIKKMAESETGLREQDAEFGELIDKDEHLYRRLGKVEKDLLPYLWERHLKIAYYLYLSNPLCFRLIELSKDFAVGDGISFKAVDPGVQKVLQNFWDDEINNMDLRQFNMALELALNGEQAYVPTVNPFNGAVRLETVDSLQIQQVKPLPRNANVPDKLVLKQNGQVSEKEELVVIRRDENPYSDSFGRLTGDAFFFTVNKVTNATRGHSDVLALIDWIEGYDEFLYTRLENAQLRNMHIWDVMLDGAGPQEIKDFLEKNRKPKPGSIRAHNEKVTWNAIVPEFKASDAMEEARMIRQHILTGAGTPETWMSEGGFTNKATAGEMSVPTLKRLSTRQKFFKHMFRRIFQFVIDQAILHKVLPEDVNTSFSINIASLKRDLPQQADFLVKVTNALMIARENDWVEDETAAAFFNFMMGQFGFELERFKKEKPEGMPTASDNYFRAAKRLRNFAS